MSTEPYVSCIKINGVPIVPPLLTPEIRQKCHDYRIEAIEKERKYERNRLFKKCLDDLDRIQHQTRDLKVQMTLESQLAFGSESPRRVSNLTSETIDVSEYSDDGVRVLTKDPETPPKLIRSNSYTLESPSPILLAHLEKEAKKCMEVDDVIPSPPTVIDTQVNVENVQVSTPGKYQESGLDPKLVEILHNLPQEHAENIYSILTTQQESNKKIVEKLQKDDSISVSISSQSLYYSTLSPDTIRGSPVLKNLNNCDRNKAAAVIQAYVRGYLTRRLIRTEKVQALIETIKDALLCAIQLHGVEIIEESDVELHRRLIQQVSAACYAFHDIFFTLSVREKMSIIASDRQRRMERAKRPLSATSSNLSRKSSARTLR